MPSDNIGLHLDEVLEQLREKVQRKNPGPLPNVTLWRQLDQEPRLKELLGRSASGRLRAAVLTIWPFLTKGEKARVLLCWPVITEEGRN